MPRQAIPWSIWIRALVYMLAIGAGWLCLLPLALLTIENRYPAILLRNLPLGLLGIAIFAGGALLALLAGYYLIVQGRGTPLPLDPPRQL